MKPTVSVVTVCYNAEKTIEKTIRSILNQSYLNYEYIIVDGKSEDKTNDIIQQYLPMFEKRGITVKYISEKDNGIFNAMNKGIDMAEGVWIAFMNADDSYYDFEVFRDLFSDDRYGDYDIIYGSTNCISESQEKILKPLKLDMRREDGPFVHQSSFVKTEIMKQKHFDEQYLFAADYQLFLELWLEGRNFAEIEGRLISNFSLCGRSHMEQYKGITEVRKIRCLHDIPGSPKVKEWLNYVWWIVVHLGGRRVKRRYED